jgi:hypothetical protein
MIATTALASRRAAALVALLDIPDSYYDLAAERYRSFGDWLGRPESTVAGFDPAVYSQGSFRYGTVIRPLFKRDEYDLDAVAELLLTKADMSQRDVKHLLGDEVKSYAAAKNFNSEPEEKPRCWRLDYADQVKFHMDYLPAIPEDEGFKQLLINSGVPANLAVCSIAITDKRHAQYMAIQRDWPASNPKGFAKWFEHRMRVQAQRQLKAMLAERALASIDDVPTWEWKTPLQRTIQLLKRHRDVRFKDDCTFAPISMIITTLAAHAYRGEEDLYDALQGVLERMPQYVRQAQPRIPNPVNPAEDFADRWKTDTRYETNFWKWHAQAKADVAALDTFLDAAELGDFAEKRLRLDISEQEKRALASRVSVTSIVKPVAPAIITSAARPWGTR